jgi:hypothetical protein
MVAVTVSRSCHSSLLVEGGPRLGLDSLCRLPLSTVGLVTDMDSALARAALNATANATMTPSFVLLKPTLGDLGWTLLWVFVPVLFTTWLRLGWYKLPKMADTIPESGMLLAVGLVFGVIMWAGRCDALGSRNSVELTEPNTTHNTTQHNEHNTTHHITSQHNTTTQNNTTQHTTQRHITLHTCTFNYHSLFPPAIPPGDPGSNLVFLILLPLTLFPGAYMLDSRTFLDR